jgi:hypothetical protein
VISLNRALTGLFLGESLISSKILCIQKFMVLRIWPYIPHDISSKRPIKIVLQILSISLFVFSAIKSCVYVYVYPLHGWIFINTFGHPFLSLTCKDSISLLYCTKYLLQASDTMESSLRLIMRTAVSQCVQHSFHLWLNTSQHVLRRLDGFPADRTRTFSTATKIDTNVYELHKDRLH